jgi:hypothetical protein
MKRAWIAFAVAVPALVLGVVLLFDAPGSPSASFASDADAHATAVHRQTSAAAMAVQATPVPAPVVAASQAVAPPAPAVAMLSPRMPVTAPPDPRVPPIDPPSPDEPERAQPWEVADPALYRAREQRLERETEARFVQATASRLPQLRAAVDEMRARGAAPADIARAEDKIAHMQAVQDALLRGEPLAASAVIVAPAARP